MVEQKVAKKSESTTAVPKKSPSSSKTKSLAYGKVKFKAFLWRGKWRFINKDEAEKLKKKKLSKLAKLKAEGKEVKVSFPAVHTAFECAFFLLRLYRARYLNQSKQVPVKS